MKYINGEYDGYDSTTEALITWVTNILTIVGAVALVAASCFLWGYYL